MKIFLRGAPKPYFHRNKVKHRALQSHALGTVDQSCEVERLLYDKDECNRNRSKGMELGLITSQKFCKEMIVSIYQFFSFLCFNLL